LGQTTFEVVNSNFLFEGDCLVTLLGDHHHHHLIIFFFVSATNSHRVKGISQRHLVRAVTQNMIDEKMTVSISIINSPIKRIKKIDD
jgi:hypothetical protein